MTDCIRRHPTAPMNGTAGKGRTGTATETQS